MKVLDLVVSAGRLFSSASILSNDGNLEQRSLGCLSFCFLEQQKEEEKNRGLGPGLCCSSKGSLGASDLQGMVVGCPLLRIYLFGVREKLRSAWPFKLRYGGN